MAKSTKMQSTTVSRTTRPTRQQTAPVKATANDTSPTISSPTHGDIAMRAYELYLADGAAPGRDLEHWLRAENELRDIASRN
jgi:hypothetical protein